MDKNGYLDPKIKKVDLDWGTTYFEFEDFWIELYAFQTIKFIMVVIKNSINFVGDAFLSHMIGPIIDRFLNGYKYDFSLTSPFRG